MKTIYTSIIVGPTNWIFCVFYVKYAFNTVEDNIKLCLKCRNSNLDIKAIKQHRIAVKMCEDMNELFKIMNFIIYFMVSFAYLFSFNLILDKDSPIVIKVFLVINSSFGYTMALGIILINSQITHSAHRPRKYLYGYLNRALPFKHRMKIMSFIEMLCGPDIGFYCMDWFPLNSYEFYQYCAFCASNYFLVSSLFP